jgi:tetratricopeptide (TPR) repeat protein
VPMLERRVGSGSAKARETFLAIGLAFLVLLGLLVGQPASYAFRLQSPLGPATPREPTRQRERLPFAARAPNAAAQQETARSQVEEKAESTDDDPPQIANFEDLILKEKFQEVEPLLRTYLAAHPRSWKAYYFLGYVEFRQRRIADSVKALAKSLELNVDNAAAHRILGRELFIIGRGDLALREFEQALRLDPNSAEVHYNMGRVYAMQDDFPRARQELEKAIQLDANYMEAYNALGFAMEVLGDDATSLQDYQTAIRLNQERLGKFDAPYVNASGYYNRRGNFDLAVEYATKALELNPRSDLAYFQIAKACRAKGDWAGEAEAIGKAISIRPSSQYYYVLGVASRKLGKIKESQQAFETFQRLEKQTADLESQRREARRATRGLELRPDE